MFTMMMIVAWRTIAMQTLPQPLTATVQSVMIQLIRRLTSWHPAIVIVG